MKMYLFPLLFLFIYSPFVEIGGVRLMLPIILPLVFLFVGFPFALEMYQKYRVYRTAVNILLVNGCVLLAIFIFHGGEDSSGLIMSGIGIVTLIGAAFFVCLYRRRYGQQYASKLIFDIFLVGVCHAIVIIAIIVSVPFGEWMKLTFFYSEKTLEVWGDRSPGLSVSGFGALSLSQAMTGILGVISLLLSDKKNILKLQSLACIIIGLPLIFLSILASGRSGLVTLIIAILMFVMLNARIIISNKRSVKYILILLLGIGILFPLLLDQAESGKYANLLRWSFELFYNYKEQGEIGTGSTNIVLETMYFLPDSILSQIVGTGNFGRLEPPLPTDVGYVLIIFGAGFAGLISLMAVFAYFTMQALQRLRQIPLVANAVLMVTVMLVLANFKDPFFFHIYGINQIVLILYALMSMALFDYKNEKVRVKNQHGRVFSDSASVSLV